MCGVFDVNVPEVKRIFYKVHRVWDPLLRHVRMLVASFIRNVTFSIEESDQVNTPTF